MIDGYRAKTGIQIWLHVLRRAPHHAQKPSRLRRHEGHEDPRADVPAYAPRPRAAVQPDTIAFAEVYLALQNGTVEAQENR